VIDSRRRRPIGSRPMRGRALIREAGWLIREAVDIEKKAAPE
jgi:hypothetical protein